VTNSGNDGTNSEITTWNVIEGIGELKFSQGFGESWIENTDMFTFYASYEGRYDVNKDVSSASTADVAYLNPGLTVDANGRKIMMASTFAVGTKFNYLNDTGVTEDGVDVDLTLQLAPSKLSSDNIAWYSANLELVAGKTLYQLCDNYENNLLSVTLVDRIEANYTDALEDGKIPTFAQGTNSLGNKIRGLSSGEYGSTLNFVNNFDIRVNGPNNMLSFIKGVYPRLIFFFDAGYATGKVYNAVSSTNELVLSTGGQFVMNIMDFADLGMQVAYLIKGENPNHVDEKLVSGVVFGLKF